MDEDEAIENMQLLTADLLDERSRTRGGFRPSAPGDQPITQSAAQRKEQADPRRAQLETKKDGRKPTARVKAAEEAKKKAEAEKEVAEALRREEAERRQASKREEAEARVARDERKKAEADAKAARHEARRQAEAEKEANSAAEQEMYRTRDLEARQRIAELEEANRLIETIEDNATRRIAELEQTARRAQRETEKAHKAAEEARKEIELLKAQPPVESPAKYGNPYREDVRNPVRTRQLSPVPWDMDTNEDDPMQGGLERPAGMSTEDKRTKKIADNIRKIHPELADYSDEFLSVQSVAELKKMTREAANAETAKPGKRLEIRHQHNYAKARANPVTVSEGQDNRSSILHEARYLPGAAVKGQEHWLNARKIWGPQGVDAICNYDLTALGMAGCITAKGMEALHNPGSEDISLKMFSVTNAINAKAGVRTILSAGEDRFETQESWKEVSDMNELRTAFRNMKHANFMVRPWDYSLVVLEAWLNPTFWLNEELKAYKKASLIGDFIDHVLTQNASNWVQEEPYLDLAGIQTQWNSWWGVRKTCATKESKEKPEEKSKGKTGHDNKFQKSGNRGGSGGARGGGGRGGGGNRCGRSSGGGGASRRPSSACG